MASSKHNFTMTEIKAGIMVLLSIAVAAGFVAAIIGLRAPGEKKVLYAKFTNTIGIDNNAPVRFGGLLVGRVAEIIPDPGDHSLIRLRIEVEPGIPVNEDSIASVEQTTLTAPKHLEITTGAADAALIEAEGEVATKTKGYGFIPDLPDLSTVVDGSGDLLADLRDLLGVKDAKKAEAEGKAELGSVERVITDVRKLLGIQEAVKLAEAEGDELSTVAALSKNIQDLLGVESAQEAEEQGEGEMASVARITGDVRELLGVQAAKAKEAEGGQEFTELTDITYSVNGLVGEFETQLDKLLQDIEPMKQSVQSTLDEARSLLADNRGSIDRSLEGTAEIIDTLKLRMEELTANLTDTLENVEGLTDEAAAVLQSRGPALEHAIGDLGITIRNLNTLLDNLKRHPNSIIFGKPVEGRD